jgi:hypothetical protein
MVFYGVARLMCWVFMSPMKLESHLDRDGSGPLFMILRVRNDVRDVDYDETLCFESLCSFNVG